MISYLWAQDLHGVIGKDNRIPWRLPGELQYFKETTMGHPIVMGRKTYDSLPKKPLPGRQNIILTRDQDFKAEDCLVFHSKETLLAWIENQGGEVFVIGGAEIFRLLMDEVDRLYVTKIQEAFKGDVYFPDIDWSQWKLLSSKRKRKDEKNPHDYDIQIYERNEKQRIH